MGFIERLRQEVDSVEQWRKREDAFHRQRRDQAANFQLENGIGVLISEFSNLLKASSIPDFDLSYIGVQRPVLPQKPLFITGSLDESSLDPDSSLEIATWGKINLGIRKGAGYKLFDLIQQMFLVVETRPDGNIIFHAYKKVTIPTKRWRNKKDVLELALEQSFRKPGMYEYAYYNPAKDSLYRSLTTNQMLWTVPDYEKGVPTYPHSKVF